MSDTITDHTSATTAKLAEITNDTVRDPADIVQRLIVRTALQRAWLLGFSDACKVREDVVQEMKDRRNEFR